MRRLLVPHRRYETKLADATGTLDWLFRFLGMALKDRRVWPEHEVADDFRVLWLSYFLDDRDLHDLRRRKRLPRRERRFRLLRRRRRDDRLRLVFFSPRRGFFASILKLKTFSF